MLFSIIFLSPLLCVCVCLCVCKGARVAISNLSSKQNKLDEEVLKQKELLYTQVSYISAMGNHLAPYDCK